jgi:hypothetical protein
LTKPLAEPSAPDGAATRHEAEIALRGGAPIRLIGWNFAGADLKGLDFRE